MTVRKLINQLKKMPQNLSVHIADFDNSEWESSGYASGIVHFIKKNYEDYPNKDMNIFDGMPNECIIIRG